MYSRYDELGLACVCFCTLAQMSWHLADAHVASMGLEWFNAYVHIVYISRLRLIRVRVRFLRFIGFIRSNFTRVRTAHKKTRASRALKRTTTCLCVFLHVCIIFTCCGLSTNRLYLDCGWWGCGSTRGRCGAGVRSIVKVGHENFVAKPQQLLYNRAPCIRVTHSAAASL